MKKRVILPIASVLSLLFSCGGNNGNEKSAEEYKNPLNSYEETLVKKSALEHLFDLSSVQITTKNINDDEKLFAKNGSRAVSANSSTSSSMTSIYNNRVIVSDTVVTSSKTSLGVKVTESYQTKSMIAVLNNPSEMIEKGSLTTTYGLYKKSYYKASSAKEFGVTYDLLDMNFANEDDLEYKWKNYLMTTYDSITGINYNFFRDDDNNVEALYSSSSKATVANPVFPYDATKSVTSISSTIASLQLSSVSDGYQIRSGTFSSDVDYISDYFGNPLDDGNVSHTETNTNYFYHPTAFAGTPFGAMEYWTLDSHTPVLEINSETVNSTTKTFTDITRDYQQTYGTDEYAFELTFVPTIEDAIYTLTDKSDESFYNAEHFLLDKNVSVEINENGSFSLKELGTPIRIQAVFSSDFTSNTITIGLA